MKMQNAAEYNISSNPKKLDIKLIHKYLSEESYWAKNIPFNIVKKAIKNSLCFGVYKEEKQIGFARVITDKASFAYLADVFILSEHRNKGLAKWLMAIIHAHPKLQGLRRWMLATRDAHSLYEKFGWIPVTDTKKFMQFHNPNIYQ